MELLITSSMSGGVTGDGKGIKITPWCEVSNEGR